MGVNNRPSGAPLAAYLPVHGRVSKTLTWFVCYFEFFILYIN